jgi:hypothetical protein
MKLGGALTLLVLGFFASLRLSRTDSLSFEYATIDVPGGNFTSASGINNASQIVGTFVLTT